MADKWHARGWEFVSLTPGRFRTTVAFRREGRDRRLARQMAQASVVLVLAVGLIIALSQMQFIDDPLSEVRADSRAAIEALEEGDLVALDKRLTARIGQPDFAFFFTSAATPRALGDALASVASVDTDGRFKAGVDTHAYDLALTRLAGTLALATHGNGDRALPKSWTEKFIGATTRPAMGASGSARDAQDVANSQNLLLLLSRGYWSTDFLKTATRVFWDYDHDNLDDPWAEKTPVVDARYAPAPNGTYLTDGLLALTAALTANPAASEWAFTEFQPGTETVSVDGDDHAIGTFAHYLFFEHQFPDSPSGGDETDGVGMTAVLTALSSAIQAGGKAAEDQVSSVSSGPVADALVLQALAKSLTDNGGFLSQVWDATKRVAEVVWHWVQRWGHRILDILTFTPPPFGTIAAGSNAVWYTVDGDYANAGLSLAAAVPGLAFAKIAKTAKASAGAENGTKAAAKSTKESTAVAKVARVFRPKPWKDCDQAAASGGIAVRFGRDWSPEQRRQAVAKVKALSKAAQTGKLKKTQVPRRSGTSATSRYTKNGGSVGKDEDVDHILDLQLGGSDDMSNMKPLDRTVNRSLGKRIDYQLKNFDEGQMVSAVAIC